MGDHWRRYQPRAGSAGDVRTGRIKVLVLRIADFTGGRLQRSAYFLNGWIRGRTTFEITHFPASGGGIGGADTETSFDYRENREPSSC